MTQAAGQGYCGGHFEFGGLAEELGTALQKLLRGCEALTHLQFLRSKISSIFDFRISPDLRPARSPKMNELSFNVGAKKPDNHLNDRIKSKDP